jgi:hypothetical protein
LRDILNAHLLSAAINCFDGFSLSILDDPFPQCEQQQQCLHHKQHALDKSDYNVSGMLTKPFGDSSNARHGIPLHTVYRNASSARYPGKTRTRGAMPENANQLTLALPACNRNSQNHVSQSPDGCMTTRPLLLQQILHMEHQECDTE